MSQKLKAYKATDWDRDHSVVVFGTRNNWELRAEAAGQMSGDAEDIGELVRAPEFDDLVGQRITTKHYIDREFHYECQCGVKITLDMDEANDDAEYEANEAGVDFVPLDGPAYHALRPDEVWCSSSCRDRDLTRRFEEKAQAVREYAQGADAATAMWPGITVKSCRRRVYNHKESLVVDFTFPGIGKYGVASWLVGNPKSVSIPQGSVDAWLAFTASILNAQDRDNGDEHKHKN